ncbi:hypothetical protein AUP68_03702 [Ilyonectria robusta]
MYASASSSPKRGDVGTIMWLPKYEALEKEYSVHHYEDCFDHPVVILSSPVQEMVEILIITSMNGKSSPTAYWDKEIRDGFLPIHPCEAHRENHLLLHLDRGCQQELRKDSHVKASKLWKVLFKSLKDYYDNPAPIYFNEASRKKLVDYTRTRRDDYSVKTLVEYSPHTPVEHFPEWPGGHFPERRVNIRWRLKSPTTPPQQDRTSDLDSRDSSHHRDLSNPWDSSHIRNHSKAPLEDQNTLVGAITVQELENWPAIKKALSEPNELATQALENWLNAETTLREANWPLAEAYPKTRKALNDASKALVNATWRADEAEDKWAAISGAKRSQTDGKYPWELREMFDPPAFWREWKLDPFCQLLDKFKKAAREFDGTSQ